MKNAAYIFNNIIGNTLVFIDTLRQILLRHKYFPALVHSCPGKPAGIFDSFVHGCSHKAVLKHHADEEKLERMLAFNLMLPFPVRHEYGTHIFSPLCNDYIPLNPLCSLRCPQQCSL